MKNPETFNGKGSTSFNQWWEAVTMFLGFYPETNDRQKIVWLGTLLTDTAKAWHLNRYRDLGDADTWVNYVVAIRAEYRNEREAADAQLKLGQLRYQGSIRAYMMEFQALNNFARATGEGLREKVDMAIPDSILDMRFKQNEEDPVDDEGFLQATYQAGVQVEKKKTLKQAKEAMRSSAPTPKSDGRKDVPKGKGNSDDTQRNKETQRNSGRREETRTYEGKSQYNRPGRWASKDAALTGVHAKEQEEYFRNRDDCWRCGRPGHRTYECFSFNTKLGTALPPVPWKTSVVSEGKRKRSEEPEERHTAKQQKVVAVETMETNAVAPLWEDSESDF